MSFLPFFDGRQVVMVWKSLQTLSVENLKSEATEVLSCLEGLPPVKSIKDHSPDKMRTPLPNRCLRNLLHTIWHSCLRRSHPKYLSTAAGIEPTTLG
ncbi:hypothetical protein TNCV_3763081 [Trichonephila clavipes]|uniref:Uncharacterized protein n=1 Tax=Trichonephila clavipes TaxID=2585209 RepID=A0A8X6VV72_TRICX|nr:hypothetical protein TNCV_3763081 [Trichonephila clavipes]